MANKYRGFVEFSDSDGQKFVLRLGTNDYLAIQEQLDKLSTRAFQRAIFHKALLGGAVSPGAEAQKDLTLEDAGDILDDLGYSKANDLINDTKFGQNIKRTEELERERREQAQIAAARTLGQKIATLRKGVTDEVVLSTLDDVIAKIDELTKPAKGTANP